jgi:hypothetical protein
MHLWMARSRLLKLAAVALIVAAAVVAIAQPGPGDYLTTGATNADNSAPAIDALIEGDPQRAIDVQPAVGPLSVALRLPFAAAGRALGGADGEYLFGAVACLWALALLGAALAARAHRLSDERLTGPVVLLLVAANPAAISAIDKGHPEDLIAAALATASILLAARNRAALTGLTLALAVAAKPWAALAGPVALLVLDQGHRRAIVAGALAAALLLVPPVLSNPERMSEASRVLTEQPRVYAASAWWPLAEAHPAPPGVERPYVMPAGLTRSAGQTAILAITAVLSLLYLRRRRELGVEAGLSLLAGLMLARCLLDPLNLYYYGVPFLVALVAWETHARRGIPVVSILASIALWATVSPPATNPALACALFLAWSVPAAAWLTLAPLRRSARLVPARRKYDRTSDALARYT